MTRIFGYYPDHDPEHAKQLHFAANCLPSLQEKEVHAVLAANQTMIMLFLLETMISLAEGLNSEHKLLC